MSQNKTIIPDFEFDNRNQMYEDTNANSDFYRPSGSKISSTVISGSDSGEVELQSAPATGGGGGVKTETPHGLSIPLQERVIIGVMYSVSKGLLGELFPIYLGRNIIGSGISSDIQLREQTVSDEHAVLYVRSDGYPEECQLSLTDYGSMHGTAVNERDCRYETLPVGDNDIVTIGKHYKLLVKLFNIARTGLYEDTGFMAMHSGVVAPEVGMPNVDMYAPSQSVNNDTRTVIG